MNCPKCSSAEMETGSRPILYTYEGEVTTIPAVKGDFCPACGEVVLDADESLRISELMIEFGTRVNELIVSPDFIARVRNKLGLDQRQAGEVFGGGERAFTRYESGKARPPLTLVKLLKILDLHPEFLAEILPH